ncbi:AMP-binding protein [Frankia sp. CNm7]|uniref:AMP-binding protein n=1 Tax=Frankia nepalensis TaxID=1836974 RepID=A0A937RLA2_9ACTN|nr:AMP-binding protein [Frankia nepalensis]MBL7495157.1 AMP-binding protein [Frankia nepalensis]MBL7515610.1 AMP-binding protein [Frankia nepalensis]MBL7524144.1 AMP-binding protein [Frankia nepalensis]MBL7632412.1 AMP-binding protein [Frankia nepalensis]
MTSPRTTASTAEAPMITGADVATLWDLVARRAELTPDAPLLLADTPTGQVRLTCADLVARAERVAAGLAALGVAPGTAVCWQLPTRVETVVLSMALARLGAVQVPIIHIYREREVAVALRETGARLLCVPGVWRGTDYVALAAAASRDLADPPEVLVVGAGEAGLPDGDPATLPPPPTDGEAVRWIYFTSGTTSAPKGVRHRDATLVAAGVGLALALRARPDDVGSIAFPVAHIGGPDYLAMMLSVGFPALLLEAFVPADAVAAYRRHGVTIAGGSTAFYTALLAAQRGSPTPEAPLVPTLRLLAGGGAPKPPELFTDVRRELGIPVAHGYGMTEIPMITQGSPADSDDALMHSEGAPLPGVEVRVVRSDRTDSTDGADGADGTGETVAPVGVEGEVRVRGVTVCAGYTDPAATAAAFDADGWFRTGDLGFLRPDGHVTLTGRLKDVIIRKGENVSAKEVEDLLYQHPKVAAAAVIGLPDTERGELVCAVVEPAPGAEPPTLAELAAFLRGAGLMVQKIPERLEVVDALPRNATLKILKHELRARYAG